MNSKKIAIDVVLLPPEEIMDLAIEVSAQLYAQTENKAMILHKSHCLPHISLAMGCVDKNRIPLINNSLKNIVLKFEPLKLVIAKTRTSLTSEGEEISDFSIGKTKKILKLHREIIRKLEPFFDEKANIEALYPHPKATARTLQWIKRYKNHSSLKKFRPHLTVGFGRASGLKESISFIASTLALCHLGNYCTCRKVLFSTSLAKK